jgi:hypothetical protein
VRRGEEEEVKDIPLVLAILCDGGLEDLVFGVLEKGEHERGQRGHTAYLPDA